MTNDRDSPAVISACGESTKKGVLELCADVQEHVAADAVLLVTVTALVTGLEALPLRTEAVPKSMLVAEIVKNSLMSTMACDEVDGAGRESGSPLEETEGERPPRETGGC